MMFISRWWQSRGFGIQSKTDYAFLHDVLRERTPYYAYSDMQWDFLQSTAKEQVTAQLLLRLANSLQPCRARVHGGALALYTAAISHGCSMAEVVQSAAQHVKLHSTDTPITLTAGTLVELITGGCHHDCSSALLLTDIDRCNAALWRQIQNAGLITYDMEHVGVALRREGRYPEHYRILKPKGAVYL